MKKFEEEKQQIINESLDRKNEARGGLPLSEDEEWVNKNDPSHKFILPEDIASDHSLPDEFEDQNYTPLTPAEEEDGFMFKDDELEEKEDRPELEADDNNKITNQEFSDIDKKRLYQIREAINENTGKIGSVSVSADEGRVDVFREPATKNDKHHFSPMTKEEKEILMENYAPYDEAIPSRKMRSEAYKDFMAGSKIEQRGLKKHGESHRGDNMKTLSDNKIQKQNRNVLRRFFGKWYAPKNENHRDN